MWTTYTTGKTEIQNRVIGLVTDELETYEIGLILTDIKIQDAEPPTEDVIVAFKAVETAKQGAETVINEAKAYMNAQLPLAKSEADKLTQNAEYLKQKRINEATEQIAMFTAMYDEYALNPEITQIRMYYEAIQQALPVCVCISMPLTAAELRSCFRLRALTEGRRI